MGARIRGFGARHSAQARRQVPFTEREREDTGGQTPGYHPYCTSPVSIGGSSRGFRQRPGVRSSCRGPSGRLRKPLCPDRRHRSCWNNSLSAERMSGQKGRGDRMMRWREFITLLGGAAAAWPLAASAQQPAMQVIGFLNGQSSRAWGPMVAAFRRGLNEAGYIEGQNVIIDYRWAEGQPDRLPALVAEFVRRPVSVIVATGGNNPAMATTAATSTIPIVFTSNDDPRKYGLVASLNRPGGNVTGVSWFSAELGPKRLALLHDLVPNVTTIALLLNPNNAETARQPAELQE